MDVTSSSLFTFTTSPFLGGVTVKTRFSPLGDVGLIVVYPDGVVGVFVLSREKRGKWVNMQAGCLYGQKFRLLGGSAAIAAALAITARAVKVDRVRVPPLWVACRPGVDPGEIASGVALARWAGSPDPMVQLEVWSKTVVGWGQFTMVPLELFEGPVDPAWVYEDMDGLHENGVPIVQKVPTRWLEALGMGEGNLRFTQKRVN